MNKFLSGTLGCRNFDFLSAMQCRVMSLKSPQLGGIGHWQPMPFHAIHVRQQLKKTWFAWHGEAGLLFALLMGKFHLPSLPNVSFFDGPKGPNVEPKPARNLRWRFVVNQFVWVYLCLLMIHASIVCHHLFFFLIAWLYWNISQQPFHYVSFLDMVGLSDFVWFHLELPKFASGLRPWLTAAMFPFPGNRG